MRTEKFNRADKTSIFTNCKMCHQSFFTEVDTEAFAEWKLTPSLTMVQDFFPDLSPEDRELFFISGICVNCWNSIF